MHTHHPDLHHALVRLETLERGTRHERAAAIGTATRGRAPRPARRRTWWRGRTDVARAIRPRVRRA